MVAGIIPATRTDRSALGEMPGRPIGAVWLLKGSAGIVAAAAALVLASPALAAANNVQITGLSDVALGTISNFGSDTVRAQSVCAYSNTKTSGYHVTANGTGTGGAFTLASGAQTLAYDVQWSNSSGQSSGTQLGPNVALTGQTSSATQAICNKGPATTASLIVIVRSTAVAAAMAGTYSGTLTLVLGPE
jgi:hypothetical protein